MMPFQRYVFPLVSLSIGIASSQNTSMPLEYFCTRVGHSTVRKGDAIYIYGGVRDPRIFNTTSPSDHSLIKLDLSNSWDVLKNDQPATFVGSPNLLNHPPSFLIESGLYFSSDGAFHVYGGGSITPNTYSYRQLIASPVMNGFWTLSSTNQSWSSSRFEGLHTKYAPISVLSAQAPEHDLAFIFNGVIHDGSSESVYSNMIIINTRAGEVRTVSTHAISNGTGRVGATLQYLPLLGSRGALVLFGGATKRNNNVTTDMSDTMVTLDTIHIFDIASLDSTPDGIWYTQSTSGRSPLPRMTNCAVNIPSPDKTSYHIYMYSGHAPSKTYHDVWVLSLPQFLWTQVFAGTQPDYGAACQLVGKKQMLKFGGNDSDTLCIPPPQVALFDLTNLKWARDYVKDDEEFRVPKAISNLINGSAMGEAKMREPEGGFESAGLVNLFDGMNKAGELHKSGASRQLAERSWVTVMMLALLIELLLL